MSTTRTQSTQDRHAKVKSILVTQPEPKDDKSPYRHLAREYNLTIDFRPFIEIQPLSLNEFRKQKINITDHTAVIFTSRNAVDYFFKLCSESRIEMPPEMKYFCISDQTAYYLQNYITVRKRKVFKGEKTAADLIEVIKKHKDEKFLFPCSDIRKDEIPRFMAKEGYNFTEAVIYKTVASDLSDLADVNYDVIVFFSPSGITSLFTNFPDFKQNKTRIAVFGPTTAKAAEDADLIIDIQAPMPNALSMTDALELYVKKANKVK